MPREPKNREPKQQKLDAKTLYPVITGAQAHGEESDPDHTASDLEEALHIAWGLMTSEQRAAFLGHEAIREIIDWGDRKAQWDAVAP